LLLHDETFAEPRRKFSFEPNAVVPAVKNQGFHSSAFVSQKRNFLRFAKLSASERFREIPPNAIFAKTIEFWERELKFRGAKFRWSRRVAIPHRADAAGWSPGGVALRRSANFDRD
jgi:hypothetical protein